LALLIVATGSFALATEAEHQGTRAATAGERSPTTPVLSARRVPAMIAAPVADDRLVTALQQLVAESPGTSCLDVVADGRPVFTAATTAPVTPASLQKIVTGFAALSVLGADSTLTTKVVASAAPDNGIVDGDLYLVGGGDPLLMTDAYASHFKHPPAERSDPGKLADAVAAAGIKEVRGRLLGDESRYDSERYPPSWPERFAREAESGPLSALTLDRGLDEYPPNFLASTPKAHPADNPPAHAADVFALLLAARGVTVAGGTGVGAAPSGSVEVAALASAPVRSIVGEMLRESDNTAAELLTKELGVASAGSGTTAAGAAAIRAKLAASGLPVDGTAQIDGSGLSGDDRETCGLLNTLLVQDGASGPLSSTLPIAGQTGTLEKRFVGSPVAGRLRAKTGSLNQVTALAGVLPTAKGVTITFSYVLNVTARALISEDVMSIQDGLVEILDSYPSGPNIAALGPLP
jgi:D-alanyl-D-alanine carboxypeptidase/D-alanyl-D-alanine-endopeptidase (penicillin-binding protein 4)